MPMRLSGLMSGMDTDSIIQQLVEARKTKVDTKKKAQTKLDWKQEAWKGLNTKLQNLQSKIVGNMRFSSSYSKKTTKVSNSSAVSVITGDGAVNGVQSLSIDKLAKTGYLTGGKIGEESEHVATDKISEVMGLGEGEEFSGSLSIKAGDKTIDLNVTENTTISDFLNQLKDAGLNASFDAKQQRFFISAKESGAKNDFSITAKDANGQRALAALGLQVDLHSDKAALKEYSTFAALYDGSSDEQTMQNLSSYVDKTVSDRTDSYLKQYKSAKSGLEAAQKKLQEISDKYDNGLDSAESYTEQIKDKNEEIKAFQESMKGLSGDELKDAQTTLADMRKDLAELNTRKTDATTLENQEKAIQKYEQQLEDVAQYITVDETEEDGETVYNAQATDKLTQEVEESYYNKAKYAAEVMSTYDPDAAVANDGLSATKVSGQDAEIYLNGALFTNSTNTFEINGLTFTALSETAPGETVTVTTEQDTDGIYDMVKNFIKEYNEIINEMDKLYNAESTKGYDPLTNDEKSAMSDAEVEEWEKKIKDGILRRDENLSSVSSALKEAMSSGFEVNGKKMFLFDFGINVASYFTAAENEKNAYHIDGDPDDSSTSGNADKLKSMIASDPDAVISFFTQLSQNLYGKMFDMSRSVDGQRSFGSFYDDKKMKSDYDNYTSKIADMEEQLNDYEDRWYKKFSAMETAMAKMQSNMNAVSALLGGG
ncbi:MAG: flagellar filament capping protein FliD [Lachnospiraceae bacterium]|nr:flagellar filament capping protein FliD [Lachnospiraceae bacterium]